MLLPSWVLFIRFEPGCSSPGLTKMHSAHISYRGGTCIPNGHHSKSRIALVIALAPYGESVITVKVTLKENFMSPEA